MRLDSLPPLRAGSLCTGFGGLEMGAASVLGPLQHLWHAEYDPAPSAVLAHHWPDVPNLGDITALDFAGLPAVDLLTAGYPCQPFSDAGHRKAFDDPRNMWPHVQRAIRELRPRIVLLENVRGHLNRGFDQVTASLARIGYVGRWRCVRASDAGAAHRRERLFVIAWPHGETPPQLRTTVPARDGCGLTLLPTPTARDGRRGAGWGDQPGRPLSETIHRLLPTPKASDGDVALPAAVQPGRWGDYADAVDRWAGVIGRPAPEPTTPGRNGPVLSPLFVEWLMGLPQGYVTDIVTKRNPALKVLGNGVVPQAAALALNLMLADNGAGEVAA